MALLRRIPQSHSIHEFRKAARSRVVEAKSLAMSGYLLASIYLCGYAVEMILKSAYFAAQGRGQRDPITLGDIRNVRKIDAPMMGVAWPSGNLYDINRWVEMLLAKRRQLGIAYRGAFARSLSSRVRHIALNWREDLRYWSRRPHEGELAITLNNAEWLLGQSRSL